jgi:hypothetical protein
MKTTVRRFIYNLYYVIEQLPAQFKVQLAIHHVLTPDIHPQCEFNIQSARVKKVTIKLLIIPPTPAPPKHSILDSYKKRDN